MKTIRDVLRAKGDEVFSVHPDASVYDAIKLMAAHEIGALMVLENNRLIGVISETDYARKIILKGRTSADTRVREIMTEKVRYISPDRNIDEGMAIMTDSRFRHLPVMDNGKLVGVVSIGDLVKTIIQDQQFTIEQLERYITG